MSRISVLSSIIAGSFCSEMLRPRIELGTGCDTRFGLPVSRALEALPGRIAYPAFTGCVSPSTPPQLIRRQCGWALAAEVVSSSFSTGSPRWRVVHFMSYSSVECPRK